MAMEEIKLTQNVHNEALGADASDKKKGGKFQPFKKLFGKRKKKDASLPREASSGKKSPSPQSVSNGTSSDEETLEDSLRSFNCSMGTRAFSHDSIFIPDGGAESEQTVQAMSQDNILGKVKTLQRQLSKNIKFGQPPASATPMKKAHSGEASLEEDLPPTRPMDTVAQQDVVLSDAENKSSDTPGSPSSPTLPGASSEMEEKVAPAKPSRPKRHFSSGGTIESVNLDAIPLAIARLDNSAAKHKLAVKPKNQRVSKKHRRLGLAGERPKEQGGLPRQLSLDQNGHPGEDKPTWPEEEPEPLDSEEEQRRQEEYWRELEAKCKRQKAEAAERRRREEQRLQALERRLWEEHRRQELLEQQGEAEEGEPQLEAGNRPRPEERQGPQERGGRGWECREPEAGGQQAAEEQERPGEEAERPQSLAGQEELEAQSRREAEKRREEEDRAQRELRRLEELEEQRRQEAEKQRQEEEERKRQEEEERKRLEEEERKQRLEEEERKKRLEEQRRQEAEKQRQEEEEKKRLEELRRQQELEEQRRREEEEEERTKELRRQEELEEQRRREEEEPREAPAVEAVSPPESDRSPPQTDFAEDPEQGPLEPGKPGEDAGQPRGRQKQSQEAEPAGEQQGEPGRVRGQDGRVGQETREQRSLPPPRKQEGLGDTPAPAEKEEAATPEKGRKVEELRWQEVDERQTMPRPYTFQVSSGGKQILFPKVNLSPVTPVKDAGPASAAHEPKAPKASPAPHALPLSLSVPHTAILVTGAQLCGPAVNLSQIKDTACKSLLGLSEEKKHVDVPTLENPPRALADPRAGSGKARPPQESPSSAAALAEWASIRSRILKNAESDQHSPRDQSQPADEHTPRGRCDSRGSGNLRKTPLGNAKFSIMPAWQKFSDGGTETSKRNTEAESIRRRPVLGASDKAAPLPPAADSKDYFKGTENLGVHQEPTDTTEGCKFAKDLPSFLVPSLPCPPQNAVAQAEPVTTLDSGTTSATGTPDPVMPGGEEKASPFGIKLRRTNYSLRFHCDQQTEKKKKRLSSTGDGADGGPPAPGSTDGEKETEGVALKHGLSVPLERKQAPSTWEDSAVSPASPSPAVQPGPPSVSSQAPAPEHKAANRMPLAQKPALAPKPAGQTPPSSPLCKLSRPYLMELLAGRQGKPDPEPSEPGKEDQESSEPQPPSPPPPEERKAQKREEEEVDAERKAAFPALPAAPAEKPSQIPEAGRKDRPVLQSRHSLDGSRLAEKAETSQPLWITLALQKQKGFREQQATREERKHAREAKQAGKLSKDHASVSPQPGSSGVSRAGSLHKPEAQPEEKPETAVSRLERREQLKKANTLPTSVTVEISDSTAPAPLVKEVTKRFSTPDAAPVSTEPAWLALAKRKAKAWSDCPQIIK